DGASQGPRCVLEAPRHQDDHGSRSHRLPDAQRAAGAQGGAADPADPPRRFPAGRLPERHRTEDAPGAPPGGHPCGGQGSRQGARPRDRRAGAPRSRPQREFPQIPQDQEGEDGTPAVARLSDRRPASPMFDALGERLQVIFRTLRGHGHLTENEIREGLREIRMALLEADVDLSVVKDFTEAVRQRAATDEVLKSLTPGHHLVKVVRDEMVAILGGEGSESALKRAPQPPSIYLMTGLQGSGKTTTSAKLARLLKGQGRSPLLVPADVRRPAAVDQLRVLGTQIGVPVVDVTPGAAPADVCREALREARLVGRDPLIVDTAGRLHIDEELMTELH